MGGATAQAGPRDGVNVLGVHPEDAGSTGERLPSRRGRAILERIEALPADRWQGCPGCAGLLHRDQLRRHHGTCHQCGHLFRLCARERIALLADAGTFIERHAELLPTDPLDFTDRLAYPERLAQAQARTGLAEAAIVGLAEIGGRPVVLAVLDFAFLGGSMGSVVGEKVARAAELALDRGIPFIVVSSSGGARMQEGVISLLQMAKTAAAIRRLRDAGVPSVSVLTDPVYGGVTASFASLGDVIIAEAGARAGFAGPRVIEQTIGQKLPAGFQTAESLRDHGHIDLVSRREDLRETVRRAVACFAAARQPFPAPIPPSRPAIDACDRDAWEAVRLARELGRPTAREYIESIFVEFVELHGDRWAADDPAVVGGLAVLDSATVVVVGHCKGRNTAENVRRNFGMPHPSGYRKAMRLFGLAERLGVPVVTLIDTPGAYPGLRAEEANQSGAIAETLALAAGLRVPIVSVVTGEGGSGGALALAVGDRLLMQERSIFSVISPEGCATILFGDASRAADAARALRLRASDLYRFGIADELIPEPVGGSQADPTLAARLVASSLRRHLRELTSIPAEDLVARRYDRIRTLHAVTEAAAEKEDAHV